MSLYRPSNARKLLEYPVGIDSYDPFNTRQLASKKYTSVIPTFGPPQGYLNFEVAIEKSDSGNLDNIFYGTRQNLLYERDSW